MKKIMVLGAAGMAGHMIIKYLQSLNKYKIITQARNADYIKPDYYCDILYYPDKERLRCGIDFHQPDIIINTIGLLVRACNDNPAKAIYLNSYFPHWLESITRDNDTKVITLSTDCIYDGDRGYYNEADKATETSWYGRTKALGELVNDKDLTLRMSIIGPELKPNGTGLFQWFMRQTGEVRGFSECLWTGLTTLQLSKSIDDIITKKPDLAGFYHLVPDVIISKYDLLRHIARIWKKTDLTIIRDETIRQNKCLINTRLSEYDPKIPDYETQLQELHDWTAINDKQN